VRVIGKVTSPDGPVADAQIVLRIGDEQELTVDSDDDGTFTYTDESSDIGKTIICTVTKAGYEVWERPFQFLTEEIRPNVQLQPKRSALPWKLILATLILLALAAAAFFFLRSPSVTVTVPVNSNPWLAGMPGGHQPRAGNPPVQVLDLKLNTGKHLTFTVATGNPTESPASADGTTKIVEKGPEHGISGAKGPGGALVGVFLGVDLPTESKPPDQQDFSKPIERDKTVVAPAVREVFFIGDGRTNAGVEQHVIIPDQASRLFLGTMDSGHWKDNKRSYQVVIKAKRI
jgi:hypothetical protein